MDRLELADDPTILEWLDIINIKESTQRTYYFAVQHYTNFTGMSPAELIEQAEDDIISGKLPRRRRIKSHIVGFRSYLQKTGMAPLSVKRNLAVIRSFYKAFEIDFPTLPNNERSVKPQKKNSKLPTIDDIRDVLAVADPKETAMLLCGYSSGMGSAELSNLSLREFEEGYDPETEITTLDIRREKVGFDFITFLSPEASRAVWRYIDYRNRPHETTERYSSKMRKTTPDSPLFIKNIVPNTYLETHDEELRRMTTPGIGMMYQRLSAKAGKNTGHQTFNIIRSHNMRKMFNSALKNAGCNNDLVEYFMGHTLGTTREAYYRPDIEKLKETYIEFVPHLLVSTEFELKEKLVKKAGENAELRAHLDKKDAEMEVMKIKMSMFEKYIKENGLQK